MKKLFILALLVLPLVAEAQGVSTANQRLNANYGRSKSLQMVGGPPMAFIASPVDTAKDNANYLAAIASDLGGRLLTWGVHILSGLDTVTSVVALESSIDSTTWTVRDSVSVTSYTAGKTFKRTDLSLFRDPYWRIRMGLGGASDDYRFNGVDSTGKGDSLYFFIITNFHERF